MEALYRTYRPTTFADVAGQEHVTRTLLNQLAAGTVAHAYLFTGPRGVGKTTAARLLARAVNCEQQNGKGTKGTGGTDGPKARSFGEPCNVCSACTDILAGRALDVVEMDAASQTGVDNVRENIVESVRFAPSRLRRKVYVIDEVHMLSTSSFNALLKTLEEPPAHALFVLATTELHKVPATIISRCQRFDFRRIPEATIVACLRGIVEKEGREADEDVLCEIARQADGGLRDAESLLGQVLAVCAGRVTMEDATLVMPAVHRAQVDALCNALLARDADAGLAAVGRLVEQGADVPHVTDAMISALRDRMLAEWEATKDAPKIVDPGLISDLLEARRLMKGARIPQLPLELLIVNRGGKFKETSDKIPPYTLNATRSAGCGDPAYYSPSPNHSITQPLPPPVPSDSSDSFDSLAPSVPSAPPPSSPIPTPVAVALGDVPVLDLEDVRRKWPEVFEQIKSCNATLPMVMKTGEVSGVEGDAVEITFAYPLYVEAVNQDKNRKLLEQVLTRVLGRPTRVKARHVKKEIDQAVDQLLDAFGGSVV